MAITSLKKTTYIKQGAGLHIEMITVNGWYRGGRGGGRKRGVGVNVYSAGEMGKDFCPNLRQPFF